MNDHARRIKENARMAEMERKSAPLFWLVYIVAVAVCIALIAQDYEQNDAEQVEKASFRESVFKLNQQYIDSNPKVKKIVYGREK